MTKTSTILGISPGTRTMGLAVIRDGELTDWRVKSFKGGWNDSKLKDILYVLKTYIEDAGVTAIVLKKPDVFRTSTALESLITELKSLCQRMTIRIDMFSLKTMKNFYSKQKDYTKAKMIREIASKYPELYADYNKEMKSKHAYYIKMFEAILLASIDAK